MAEALRVAASVISVASFAIQLADSVKKACDFWESVEDGPGDIDRISRELRLLSNILRFISREQASTESDPVQDELVMSALQIAKTEINELTVVVTQLASNIAPDIGRMKRKWGRVQIALKGGKIEKMKTHIESAKSTLNILQTSRTQAAMCRVNGMMIILSANMSTNTQPQPHIVHRKIEHSTTRGPTRNSQ